MLETGDTAPNFTLPGYHGGETDEFSLAETTADGEAVLLVFYPLDFNPVCTEELCSLNDADWFSLTEGVTAWGISGDGVFAHEAFADESELTFPLLSDHDGSVALEYGVLRDGGLKGHGAAPNRSVFVVDSDMVVRYAWTSEDPEVLPDFGDVHEAVTDLPEAATDA